MDDWELHVGDDLFTKINRWHGEHEGEPLTLTASEVCELAGCARGGEYADD